ncbi:universal stress protein [Desulfothermus okinawensis JCM 13304]
MEKKEIKRILCAVDFAEYSKELVSYAVTLQQAFDADLDIIYVAPTLSQYVGFQISPSSIENFVGEIIQGAEETMEKFIKENFADNPKVSGKVITGYAAEEIINYSKENNIDLIVMGTHGRKGIDRILFGSVAEKVVKSSNIPVLTIRPKNK